MADAEEAKKSRDRSPNFPFIGLDAAMRRVQEFYDHEKRGSAPYEVAASHWNYSSSSSGAVQTVAALKQYGLMSDEGSGKQRKVRLTELALRIILDQREDPTERMQYKRQAAMTPPVIAEIYQHWPDGLPSEQTLHHHLVIERQFNDNTATRAVKILKQNELFTGMYEDAMLSDLSKQGGDSMSLPALPLSGDRNVTDAEVLSMRHSRQKTSDRRVEVLIDPATDVAIEIHFLGEASRDAYEYIRDYVDMKLKRFKKPDAQSSQP